MNDTIQSYFHQWTLAFHLLAMFVECKSREHKWMNCHLILSCATKRSGIKQTNELVMRATVPLIPNRTVHSMNYSFIKWTVFVLIKGRKYEKLDAEPNWFMKLTDIVPIIVFDITNSTNFWEKFILHRIIWIKSFFEKCFYNQHAITRKPVWI